MTFDPTTTEPQSPSTAGRVRLTISVTPEVHATFQRMAAAGSISISRAMGEWLGDTLDAAEFMAQKLEEARAAPKRVAREMHAYALGLADQTAEVLDQVRRPRAAAPGRDGPQRGPTGQAAAPEQGVIPPSSNTGGKGHPKRGTSRGGKLNGNL